MKSDISSLDPEKALQAYLEDGPTAQAAKRVGVPTDIFRAWVASPEGRRAIDTARSSLNALLDLGLTRIIDQAADRVLQAIEKGDTVVLKDGTTLLRPMPGKDAAAILATVFDRRQVLRKLPTVQSETDEKLEELAAKLRYLGQHLPVAPLFPGTIPLDMSKGPYAGGTGDSTFEPRVTVS